MRTLLGNHRLALLVLLAIVLAGLGAIRDIGKERWPAVEMPLAFVVATYPGAPPELVEAEVTSILERHLEGLPGQTALRSSSIESASLVLVEFDVDADLATSMDEVLVRMDDAETELPADVDSLRLERVAVSNEPVYSFSLAGALPPTVLRGFAVQIRDHIESVDGVSEVRTSGLRDDQLQVLVDEHRLQEIGGTLDDVSSSLERAQSTAPLGRFQTDKRNFPIDVERIGLDMERLRQLPVKASASGTTAPLSSVATLQRALAEPISHDRLVRNLPDGTWAGDAIGFDVLRQVGADVPTVTLAVAEALDELRADLPPQLELVVTTDRGAEIIAGLTLLFSNGWQAMLLVFLVLLLVLGARESIVAGLSIPVTFLVTFIVLQQLGQSINNLSLMALVIALGLLVDDFILVMEGMHEHLHAGKAPLDAAAATLTDYALPSLSGTLTTLAAFFPLAMLGGMEGKFVQVIPITICVALISSYLISITLDMSLGAVFLRASEPNFVTRRVGHLFSWAERLYAERIVPATLSTRTKRRKVLGAAAGVFALSLLVASTLDSIFYPDNNEMQLGATFVLPAGTALGVSQGLAADVERALVDIEEIEVFTVTAGTRSGLAMSGPEDYLEPFEGEHLVGVTMQLVPPDQRELASFDLAEVVREKLEGLSDAEVQIHQIRMGAGSSAPVEVQVTAKSVERAEGIAETVLDLMRATPDLSGLSDTRQPHQGAYTIELSDEALRFHGLNRDQVLSFLRSAITGTTADTVVDGDDEVDIEVGYDWRRDGAWNSPASLEEILSLHIPAMFGGESTPLAAVGSLQLKSSAVSVRHSERKHVVTLSAVSESSPIDAANALAAQTDAIPLEAGEAIAFLGDKAKTEQTSSELVRALAIAVALIFTILVVQFRSFVQPVVILIAMPLALTGVFFGFRVFDIPLSFPAMIGMVALAGIVVNDAIVLVDAINRNRRHEGMAPVEAVLKAGTSRLRPIVVTTVTTVIGLLPLALTDPVWEGLCMAVVFGISLATALTLVVIPAIYLTIERADDVALG